MTILEFNQILAGSKYLNYIDQCRQQAEKRQIGIPLNKHHIYPRSFQDGKIDTEENLIEITTEEHLTAHILLVQSLKDVGRDNGRSYHKALRAVQWLFKLKKTRHQVSDEYLNELICQVPEVSCIINESLHIPRTDEEKLAIKRGRAASHPVSQKGWKRRPGTGAKISDTKRASGYRHSEETRQKMSEAGKKRTMPWTGKHLSEEHRAKLSAIRKGRSPWNKGIPRTEEEKVKMRMSHLGKPSPRKGVKLTEEQKQKISRANKGRRHTEEARRKISEAQKGRIPWNKGKKKEKVSWNNIQ